MLAEFVVINIGDRSSGGEGVLGFGVVLNQDAVVCDGLVVISEVKRVDAPQSAKDQEMVLFLGVAQGLILKRLEEFAVEPLCLNIVLLKEKVVGLVEGGLQI